MHPIFFSFKRAHHASLRMTRPLLKGFGLTPARFDALYKIYSADGLMQFELCEALGVSRATVSRMLGSLEDLGLISRQKLYDNVTKVVELTKHGRSVIEGAIHSLIDSGVAQLAAESISAWSRIPNEIRKQTRQLASHLRWVCYALNDRAEFSYETDRRAEYVIRRCLQFFYENHPRSIVFSANVHGGGSSGRAASLEGDAFKSEGSPVG